MPTLQHHRLSELDREQVQSIVSLRYKVWPKETSLDELISRFTQGREGTDAQEFFVAWDGEEAIAHAEIFSRLIGTEEGDLLVMALAAVCVSPKRRGEGLGQQVVEEAFSQVDAGRYPLSLFQTGVPSFYRKFGAAAVSNEFRNRTNVEDPGATPWWEHNIMIYPGSFAWPTGIIELNGRGY